MWNRVFTLRTLAAGWLIALVVMLHSPVLANDSATRLAEASRQMANATRGLPDNNLHLRFLLLSERAKKHARSQTVNSTATLNFFSQTRRLFWSEPRPQNAEKKMRDLETAAVGFASSVKYNLDLPPIGNSPVLNLPQPQTPSTVPEPIYTPEGLLNSARIANNTAQQLWNEMRNVPQRPGATDARARQDLFGVAESLNTLVNALERGNSGRVAYNLLAANRARFLFSYQELSDNPEYVERARQLHTVLDLVIAAYRQVGQ